MIAGDAAVVRGVTVVRRARHVQVGDRDQADALAAQVGGQSRQVGIGFRVGGERPVAVLEVDVQPDHVSRNAFLAQARGNAAHFVSRHVAVTRLLVAQRPQRRQRRPAGKIGVARHDLLHGRSVDQVVVDRAAVGAERQRVRVALSEVEPAAPGVVEEDAVAAAFATRGDEERNALVERISGFGEAADIGVPVHERAAAAIQRPGLVAEAEVMFGLRHRLVQFEDGAIDR